MKRYLAIASALVLVLVLGGASLASAPAGKPTAKACVTAKGNLKLVNDAGRCVKSKRFVALAKGGPGTVRGYAHITSGGAFDAARSWNVKASNVVTTTDGFWCFTGMPFTPKGAQVTLDYNGILNGQVPQATVVLPADASDCDLVTAQAEVFTGLVNTSTFNFTAGAKLGFYVLFY